MMKLFVGNLSFQTTETDLMSIFSQYGTVETVNVVTDRMTGQPRGFAFVEMADRTQAEAAINALNGSDLQGRTLNVNEARPKTSAPPRSGGFGRSNGSGGGGGGGGFKSRNRW